MTGPAQANATASLLCDVLADLEIEGDILEARVARLDDSAWAAATPAVGWDIASQVAHLAWTDEVAILAATDKPSWDAVVREGLSSPNGFVDVAAARVAADGPTAVLERWRDSRVSLAETLACFPEGQKIPWFGPPMSPTSMATARFMETWAHGLDVADALGETAPASDRLRHLVHLGVRTRNFAFSVHELPAPQEEFRVELTSPAGKCDWVYGPEGAAQSVRGSAYDFCLLVTQRRPRGVLDLVANGPDADRWLDLAQAFAGPAGRGRVDAEGGRA